MAKLILLRHGESQWNQENRFTGWVDVDLSEKGIVQAQDAGKKIAAIPLKHVYTSALKRAINTAKFALEAAHQTSVPSSSDKALNERFYGDLQGLNKDETRKKYGDEQVHLWRRSFDVKPPGGESLKDTIERVLPYWNTEIAPKLAAGGNILVVAHGNSLRAVTMQLEKLTPEQILGVELSTGVPIVYDLDAKQNVLKKEILA